MAYVYAVDLDNLAPYSENYHRIHSEVWTDKDKLIEFLLSEQFYPEPDNWKGETVYRWTVPEEYLKQPWDYDGHIPFGFTGFLYEGEMEATIIKLEVRY